MESKTIQEIHIFPLSNSILKGATGCEWVVARKVGNYGDLIGLFKSYDHAVLMKEALKEDKERG